MRSLVECLLNEGNGYNIVDQNYDDVDEFFTWLFDDMPVKEIAKLNKKSLADKFNEWNMHVSGNKDIYPLTKKELGEQLMKALDDEIDMRS